MRLSSFVVLSLAACSGPQQSSSADAAESAACLEAANHSDLTWIQDNIFTPSCTFSGCHSGTANLAGHLLLEKGTSHDELVGQPATTMTGWMRVVPNQAMTSYLLVAIGQVPGPAPKDGTMPLQSEPMCDGKRAAIERWVWQGAPAQ